VGTGFSANPQGQSGTDEGRRVERGKDGAAIAVMAVLGCFTPERPKGRERAESKR